jgi:hypothetical protein
MRGWEGKSGKGQGGRVQHGQTRLLYAQGCSAVLQDMAGGRAAVVGSALHPAVMRG